CRVVVHGVPGEKVIDDQRKTGAAAPAEEPAAADTSPAGQEWRGRPPAAAPASAPSLPVPTVFLLSNGLTVYLVERSSLPVVSANLIVLAGSDRNAPARPGLASFTAEMLDEGTTSRSAMQIAEEADRLGAYLSSGSTPDFSFVAFRSLKRNAVAALELAADMLLHPAFPDEEIERIRHDRLTEILRQKDNIHALANKAFVRTVYGKDHPYGYTEIGTNLSLRAITRSDLSRFWSSGYVPANAALVVAGDITAEELRVLAERCLGSWKGNGTVQAEPPIRANSGRRIVIVDKRDSPQTSLRVGHIGVERASPDYVFLDVMNTAFGGLFSSRINMNLREKRGYTYGASSAFSFRRGPGPFTVATGVRTDATAPSVTEILREIEAIRTDLLSEEELAASKDSISRSLPGLFETTPQIASAMGQIFVHGLAEDYYRSLPARIESVTAADVARAAREHLKPEQIVIVAVGDRKQIEPELRSLGLGPVEISDADRFMAE
ncbi:MAG: insulinase family protein, partial [Acidobacteria bacterium]|nr:insulinase family protein [Acidobacteriota bacterium]